MKNYQFLIVLAIGVYALILFIIGIIFSQLLPGIFPATTYLLIGAWLFLIFNEVKHSWVQIHNPYVMVLEEKGDFCEVLRPGLYFIYQRFNLFSFPNEDGIFLGEQSIPIKITIPFRNIIGEIEAEIIIKIKEDDKSVKNFVYNHHDPIEMLISASKSSLRHFFSEITIDEANKEKGFIGLDELFSYAEKLNSQSDKKNDNKKWFQTEFGKRVRKCGIEPLSFKIVTVIYPETVIKEKEVIDRSERQKEVAKHEGQAKIIASKANKEARKNEGEGEGNYVKVRNLGIDESIKSFIKSGLSPVQAKELLQSNEYHRHLVEADNVLAVSGGNNSASTGAEIAAGIAAYEEQKERRKSKKPKKI